MRVFDFLFKKEKKASSEDKALDRLRDKVSNVVFDHGKGIYPLLSRITPDQDVNKIKRILDRHPDWGGPRAMKFAKYVDDYVDNATPREKIILVHYPLLHAFLATALAYHAGIHSKLPTDVVEGMLNSLYARRKDYTYIKQNYKALAEDLAKRAANSYVSTDPEKTKKVMEGAFEKTFRVVDKLLPKISDVDIEVLGRAIHERTDDPFAVLRNAGIDVEPELDEFRQFLMGVCGKKPEQAQDRQVKKDGAEKKPIPSEPEESVKVTIPKLASVKHYEEILNKMNHDVYRNMGGVPAEYLKKIKDIALAKKRAAEHIFNTWGNEGIRPIAISEAPDPNIEKHAKEIYADTERIAEEHKKGLLEGGSAFSIINAERVLADRIHEKTEELISDKSALKEIPGEQRTALKVLMGEDPGMHMVGMDRLKDYEKTLRLHMDKTRPVVVRYAKKK